MDCLGLLGEKPIIPPPPKVWPFKPVVDPGGPVVELEVVFVLAAFGSVGGVPPVVDEVSLLVFRPVGPQFVLLLVVELDVPPMVEGLVVPPMPPLHKVPCEVFPPKGLAGQPPVPPIGCPKKPMTVGALFWPYRTGFQSSLPVVGSVYFLRRKRMLLVGLIRASTLGG